MNEQFAAEIFNHASLAIVFDEGVVFFCRAFGQWLKPVRVVCHAVFHSPLLHAFSHLVCHFAIKTNALVHHVNHLLVHILREVLVHLFAVEYLGTKILGGPISRCLHVKRLLFERLSDNL